MIEPDDSIRLGLRVVRGLRHEQAAHLVEQRGDRPFLSMEDFKRRIANKDEFRTLAEIGALNCFAEHRRSALWYVEKTQRPEELFSDRITVTLANGPAVGDINSPLAPMTPIERVQADYNGMNLSTGPHPMALVRSQLKNVWRAADLCKAQNGQLVHFAGHVICRPGTAKGFVFISLEDETGVSNAIVAPPLFEKLRLVITQESFLIIEGNLQNADGAILVKSRHIEALRHEQLVGSPSHDFH